MLADAAGVRAGGFALVAPRYHSWLTPTHTLIHLDGIALGSLVALGMHTLPISRRTWLWMGLGGLVAGIWAAATIAGGTAYLDSALAVGFVGGILALIASTGAWNPVNAALRSGPLAFYGRISYGLYMFTSRSLFTLAGSICAWIPTGWRGTWRLWLSGWRPRRPWRRCFGMGLSRRS